MSLRFFFFFQQHTEKCQISVQKEHSRNANKKYISVLIEMYIMLI